MNRRAGVLLEVMLALALLVAAAIVILSTLDRLSAAAKLAHDQLVASELARSAMAKIEAGIENAQNLNGPVPAWSEPTDTLDDSGRSGGGFDDTTPPSTGWELEIRTEPSPHQSLTLVTVRAFRLAITGEKRETASFTLRQFVRLNSQSTSVSRGGGA